MNHAYTTEAEGIRLDLQFAAPDDTREAFVVGNNGSGLRVLSSTGWLDRLESDGCRLIIRSGSDSHIRIRLPEGARTPQANISFTTERDGTLSLALSADRDVVLTWESDKPRAGILP